MGIGSLIVTGEKSVPAALEEIDVDFDDLGRLFLMKRSEISPPVMAAGVSFPSFLWADITRSNPVKIKKIFGKILSKNMIKKETINSN